MKFNRIGTVSLAIWLVFLFSLLTVLEIFARYKLNYKLISLRLGKSAYFELDKTKRWNSKFVQEKQSYFKNWPIPIDKFEATTSTPRYLFKQNLKFASKDNKLVPAQEKDQVFWSSNSWGFRGQEFHLDKPQEKVRIVALGASTTEGSQTDSQTYPFYLMNELNSRGFSLEVINAGHHGQSIEDLLAILKTRVLPLKPDVLLFYEVSNNTNPGEWLDENWQGWHSWDASYGRLFRILHQRSALFVFMTKQLGFEKRRPHLTDHTLSQDKSKPSLENFEKKIREIVKISKENNTRPILATFITVAYDGLEVDYSQNPSLWEDLYLKWYPFSPKEIEKIYEEFNQAFFRIAQEENVSVVDLASQFPKNEKYFLDHIHFTPEGNQILAGLIAGFLEKEILDEDNVTPN